MKISKETHPQYFTRRYQSPLKKSWFDAWYRGMKTGGFLLKHAKALLKANDEFFKENPDYVEGAICGKKR